MRKISFGLLCLFFLTIHLSHTICQVNNRVHEQLRFKKFTIEDGLVNNRVIGITQDKYGFMWFGTMKGISRYDGYEFKNYLRYYINENDSTGFLLTEMLQAKCDSNGTVWMAGKYGVCYYDRAFDKFIRFQPDELDDEIIHCRDITLDQKGNIYFATNVGIVKHNIDTKENVFYIHDDKNSNSLPPGLVYNVFYDSRGLLWFAINGEGAGYLDQKTGNIKRFIADGTPGSLGQNLFQRIYEDSNNNIWIGNDIRGASKFDFKTETFKIYIPDSIHKNSGTVRGILEDSKGALWFGTVDGLYIFNPEDESFFRYAHTTHPISQLSHNSILNMFIDDHDGLWLGTRAGGVCYTNLHTSGFVKYESSIFNSEYYLNNNNVYGFAFDEKDNIWVATENGGVNYLDRETGKFAFYMYDPNNINSLRSNNTKTIYIDNADKVYIGTYRGGMNILDKKTGMFKHLSFPEAIDDPIIYHIYPDLADTNILWLGALRNAYLFDKKEFKVTLLTESTPEFVNPRTLPRIISICHTDDNKMIFGAVNTIAVLDKGTNEFTYIDSIGDTKINSANFVLIDRNGFLWASINLDFILKYDLNTRKFEIFNEEDGLPDFEYIQAQEDEIGNLWISTNRGIVKLENIINSSDDFEVSIFDNSDNLQGLEFLYNSTAKSRSGEILFGGTQGFNSFKPENIKPNPFVPNVIVTKFSVIGKEVKVGEKVHGKVLLSKSMMETRKIRIHHKIKIFTFDFTGFHFVSPENNQFKYMLEGYDDTWQYTDAHIRKATYSNLPRGKYTFKVDASNNNGRFSDKPFEVAIKVVPPFYRTIWFLLFVAIIFGILIYSVIRGRESELKRDKDILEEKLKQGEEEINQSKAEVEKQADELKQRDLDERIQRWANKGLITISEIINNHKNNPADLAQYFLSSTAEYMEAQQGSIYVLNDSTVKKELELLSGYGLSNEEMKTKNVNIGESLVGACYLDKKSMIITNIPDDYIKIESGLGSIKPKNIVLVPLQTDQEVIGILELSFIKALEDHVLELLENIGGIFAINMISSKTSEKMELLLQQSQQQAEEMKAQEEEMRQNLEEMQATTENAARSEAELIKLNEEMKAKERSFQKAIKEKEKALAKTQELLEKKETEIELLKNA